MHMHINRRERKGDREWKRRANQKYSYFKKLWANVKYFIMHVHHLHDIRNQIMNIEHNEWNDSCSYSYASTAHIPYPLSVLYRVWNYIQV